MAGGDWVIPIIGLYAVFKLAGKAAAAPSDNWGPYNGSWIGPAQTALAAADPAKYTTLLPSGESLFHPGAPSVGPYGGLAGLESSRITGFYHL